MIWKCTLCQRYAPECKPDICMQTSKTIPPPTTTTTITNRRNTYTYSFPHHHQSPSDQEIQQFEHPAPSPSSPSTPSFCLSTRFIPPPTLPFCTLTASS